MRLPATLLALGATLVLAAQPDSRTLATDTGTMVLHFHATGEVSTREWTDAQGRYGHSWAYDRQGEVIFHRGTRRFAGHERVGFRYHPNGAVSEAAYSRAPDGGIQWFRSTTTFDPEGNRTGHTEQGRDEHGPVPRIGTMAIPPPDSAARPGPGHGQRMFINEYFVVARRPCRVQLRPVQTSAAARDLDTAMLKGDTLRGGAYSQGEQFAPPEGFVRLAATTAKGRPIKVKRVDSVRVSPEHMRWYLMLGR